MKLFNLSLSSGEKSRSPEFVLQAILKSSSFARVLPAQSADFLLVFLPQLNYVLIYGNLYHYVLRTSAKPPSQFKGSTTLFNIAVLQKGI